MEISQRTATISDATVLLHWRNDLSVRALSRRSAIISHSEHLQWLSARLKRTQLEPFFLFEANHKAIGMCRLDIVSQFPDKYEISILVNPDEHGKGIGTRILRMTCESFFSAYPKKTIVATVHIYNLHSQKLFTNAGFKLLNQIDNLLKFEKSYEI
jgi:RimJ/RimL family protein N-acetyltransferase